MDPTIPQEYEAYQVYEQAQDQAYHFQEPQPHQYQFDAYQHHQFEDHHEQPGNEQEQPNIKEPQQQDDGRVRFHGVPRVVYDAGPDGYAGGLLISSFYIVLVDMWHAGYGLMPM